MTQAALTLNQAIATLDRAAADGSVSGAAARWNRISRSEHLAAVLGYTRVMVPRLRVETLRLKGAGNGEPQSLSGCGDSHALLRPRSDRMSRNEATAAKAGQREKKIICPLTETHIQIRRAMGFPAVQP